MKTYFPKVYFRLLKYAFPYRKRIFWAFFCMVGAAVFSVIPPWLMKNVVDSVLIEKKMRVLHILAVGLVLLYLGKAVFVYGQRYLMAWVGQRVILDLRTLLYDHIQHMPLSFISGNRVGELLSRITNDVTVLQDVVTSVVVDLVVQGVSFVGMLGFLFYINWRLTLVAFAILPLAAFVIHGTSKRMRKVGHRIQEQLARVSGIAQEALSSLRVVHSFATEEEELRRFRDQNLLNFKALIHGTQIFAALEGVVEVILVGALALILWLGGRKVIGGALTPGELVAFLGYLAFLVQPIRVCSRSISRIQQGLASGDRIFALLDMPLTIISPPSPVRPTRLEGEVRFENVHFAYEEGQEVLRGLSFAVTPGETIAIVGGTGTGKSTMVDLIPRFYDPQKGRICVDGTDLREYHLPSLRRQIGIVPQDPLLMGGTLKSNIAYGYSQGTEEEIRHAAELAGIGAFIESLPRGYDTRVGERGVTLSGGQRQRIAIARAIVRNPRILIFDEATSSLDAEVERQIQEAMQKAMAGRTAFVIAHRLSTIRNAHRIVVLSRGVISEKGTHEELLAKKNGAYARLYTLQFGLAHE